MKYCLPIFLLLTGCSIMSKPIPVKVYVPEYHYVSMPEEFFKLCAFPAPPNQDYYLKQTMEQKERILVNLYLEAAKDHAECNTMLKSAQQYQQKLKKIYQIKDTKHDRKDLKTDSK